MSTGKINWDKLEKETPFTYNSTKEILSELPTTYEEMQQRLIEEYTEFENYIFNLFLPPLTSWDNFLKIIVPNSLNPLVPVINHHTITTVNNYSKKFNNIHWTFFVHNTNITFPKNINTLDELRDFSKLNYRIGLKSQIDDDSRRFFLRIKQRSKSLIARLSDSIGDQSEAPLRKIINQKTGRFQESRFLDLTQLGEDIASFNRDPDTYKNVLDKYIELATNTRNRIAPFSISRPIVSPTHKTRKWWQFWKSRHIDNANLRRRKTRKNRY